jgi:hypothetical protein
LGNHLKLLREYVREEYVRVAWFIGARGGGVVGDEWMNRAEKVLIELIRKRGGLCCMQILLLNK